MIFSGAIEKVWVGFRWRDGDGAAPRQASGTVEGRNFDRDLALFERQVLGEARRPESQRPSP